MTAEQIVRALAANEPACEREGDLHCAFCDAWLHTLAGDDPHERDCLWRLAVEWVAADSDSLGVMHEAAKAWAATPWWRLPSWLAARRRYARAHVAHYGSGSAWAGDRASAPQPGGSIEP